MYMLKYTHVYVNIYSLRSKTIIVVLLYSLKKWFKKHEFCINLLDPTTLSEIF